VYVLVSKYYQKIPLVTSGGTPDEGVLCVVDASSYAVRATIALDKGPVSIAVSQTGDRMYIVHQNSRNLWILDGAPIV